MLHEVVPLFSAAAEIDFHQSASDHRAAEARVCPRSDPDPSPACRPWRPLPRAVIALRTASSHVALRQRRAGRRARSDGASAEVASRRRRRAARAAAPTRTKVRRSSKAGRRARAAAHAWHRQRLELGMTQRSGRRPSIQTWTGTDGAGAPRGAQAQRSRGPRERAAGRGQALRSELARAEERARWPGGRRGPRARVSSVGGFGAANGCRRRCATALLDLRLEHA
jgi:hypothetical protein